MKSTSNANRLTENSVNHSLKGAFTLAVCTCFIFKEYIILEKYQDLSFSKLLVAEARLTKQFESVRFALQLTVAALVALVAHMASPLLGWNAWELQHVAAFPLWLLSTAFMTRFHISYVNKASELKMISRLIEKNPP